MIACATTIQIKIIQAVIGNRKAFNIKNHILLVGYRRTLKNETIQMRNLIE